ncbi:MAG: MarR family transcriptional regulator [Candidatus Bathyarchaeia archaeon]
MPLVGIKSGVKGTNRIPGLSARKVDVLLFLAKHGPLNIYQIQQNLGLTSYSTAHGAVKALEKMGLLTLQSEKKTEKGVTAKVYGLTFSGLVRAMLSEDLWVDMERVVKAWKSIAPLPLRKLDYFAKCGLEEKAKVGFQYALAMAFKELFELHRMLREFLHKEERIKGVLERSREDIEKKFGEIFARVFLEWAIGPQPLDDLVKWYKVLRGDPEVRDWAVQTLRRQVSRYRSRVDITEEVLRIVEMAHEPIWEEIKKRGGSWPVDISWEVR